MLISTAHAHGLLGGQAGSHDGPLLLLGIATVVISLLVAEKKWRRRKLRLQNAAAEQAAEAETDSAGVD
jgi:hypothetical protein